MLKLNYFQIVNVADENCLDIYKARLNYQLATFGCHKLGGNQFFAHAKTGQIIAVEELCVGISDDRNVVVLVECSEQDLTQLWIYDVKVSELFEFKINVLSLRFKSTRESRTHNGRKFHRGTTVFIYGVIIIIYN